VLIERKCLEGTYASPGMTVPFSAAAAILFGTSFSWGHFRGLG
jgi:hypothetical protein